MFLPLLALVGVATAYGSHPLEALDHDRVEQQERPQFFLRPPERDLLWGDFNVLHTTDIHGWLLGHQGASWPEPNYRYVFLSMHLLCRKWRCIPWCQLGTGKCIVLAEVYVQPLSKITHDAFRSAVVTLATWQVLSLT